MGFSAMWWTMSGFYLPINTSQLCNCAKLMEKRITAATQAERYETKARFNNFLSAVADACGHKIRHNRSAMQRRQWDGGATRNTSPRPLRTEFLGRAALIGIFAALRGWTAILPGKNRNSSGRTAVQVVKFAIPVNEAGNTLFNRRVRPVPDFLAQTVDVRVGDGHVSGLHRQPFDIGLLANFILQHPDRVAKAPLDGYARCCTRDSSLQCQIRCLALSAGRLRQHAHNVLQQYHQCK